MNASSNYECASCPALAESVFSQCPISTLRRLSDVKHTRFYPSGSVIFREGDPVIGAYCQLSGEVVIRKQDANGFNHDTHATEAGALIGYRNAQERGSYQVTAVAETDAMLCFIPVDELEEIMRSNPVIMLALLRSFCQRVDALERQADLYAG